MKNRGLGNNLSGTILEIAKNWIQFFWIYLFFFKEEEMEVDFRKASKHKYYRLELSKSKWKNKKFSKNCYLKRMI